MKFRHLLTSVALAAIVAVPAAQAQYRQEGRRPYNPRYQQSTQIERLVNQAERSSNEFRRQVEKIWDSRREGQWNRGWDNEWSRGRQGGNRDWDNSGYGRGRRNGDWDRDSRYSRRYGPKEAVQRLDEALEDLRQAVNRDRRDRNYEDYRVGRDEMMEVVRAADNVDFYFGRSRGYSSGLERQWNNVKRDVDALARFYNVRNYHRW